MRGIKHGGKKGMRYRFKLATIKRQNKKQKKKQRRITGSEAIDKAWDNKMTTRQNLMAMGIAYDPNEIQAADDIMEVDEFDLDQAKALGSVQKQKCQGTRRKQRQSAAGSKHLKSGSKTNEGKSMQIIKQLEQVAKMESEEVSENRKRKQGKAKLQQNDVDFCEKMIAKHGVDYEAMSRDSLNIWQNTPKQIERKIAIYKTNTQNIRTDL